MKNSILIIALVFGLVFTGFSQTKTKKGPAYKNAKVENKYSGSKSILVKQDPNQFKGPEYKNFDRKNYEIEIVRPEKLEGPKGEFVAASNKALYTSKTEESNTAKERIIYRRVDTKDMKGKNTLKLKGPAYKNHKPNKKQ